MNRTASCRQIQPTQHQPSKSPTKRGIYINEETNKREVASIFHSPYKDGRRNKDYVNPSFISSNLFYPKEYVENNSEFIVKKNYVPTQGDIKRQAQYQQRLKTQNIQRSKTKQRQMKKRAKEENKNINAPSKILRVNDPQNLLKHQLRNLQNYRERQEEKYIQEKRYAEQFNDRPQAPIYLQKHRNDLQFELSQQAQRRSQYSKFIKISTDNKQIKTAKRRQTMFDENDRISRIIRQNQKTNREIDYDHHRQSNLLGNILRQQIKTNQERRQKKWIF